MVEFIFLFFLTGYNLFLSEKSKKHESILGAGVFYIFCRVP